MPESTTLTNITQIIHEIEVFIPLLTIIPPFSSCEPIQVLSRMYAFHFSFIRLVSVLLQDDGKEKWKKELIRLSFTFHQIGQRSEISRFQQIVTEQFWNRVSCFIHLIELADDFNAKPPPQIKKEKEEVPQMEKNHQTRVTETCFDTEPIYFALKDLKLRIRECESEMKRVKHQSMLNQRIDGKCVEKHFRDVKMLFKRLEEINGDLRKFDQEKRNVADSRIQV